MLDGALDKLSPQKTPKLTLCFDQDDIQLADSLDKMIEN